MNIVNSTQPVKLYKRIDWSRPPPVIDNAPRSAMTKDEAQIKNRALRLNGTTYRWIRNDTITE